MTDRTPPPVLHCAECRQPMTYAPGIGHYCDNRACENIHNPAIEDAPAPVEKPRGE